MSGGAARARTEALFGWIESHPRAADLAALLAGAALPLAFAPFAWRPLAVLSPALLFVLWRSATPTAAFRLGWLYGLGQFGCGVYWLYFSFHLFGEAIAPLAALLTAGFVVGMALYPGLLGWLLARGFGGRQLGWYLLAAPALWVVTEWLRGWFLTGFPWLLLGHTQVSGPLGGLAPVLGVYGVSWVLAGSAGALAFLLRVRGDWRVLAALALLWAGGAASGALTWTEPAGEPIRVGLIQGNIPQDRKFLTETLLASIADYEQLTREQSEVDLVIWPETAVPTFYQRVAFLLQPLAEDLAARGVELATGVFSSDAGGRYYNSVIKLGEPGAVYHKRHLVPFGEYLPLRGLLQALERYIAIPMSDISPGPARQPLLWLAGHPVGVSICYEDAFGEEVIRALPQAALLLNVSNDSWFGDSTAPHQHLEIARMRSLETGRPMLRATNTGISALIDAGGGILASAGQFTRGAVRGEVQPMRGSTPFVRWGNWAAVLLVLTAAAAAKRLDRRLLDFGDRESQAVE